MTLAEIAYTDENVRVTWCDLADMIAGIPPIAPSSAFTIMGWPCLWVGGGDYLVFKRCQWCLRTDVVPVRSKITGEYLCPSCGGYV